MSDTIDRRNQAAYRKQLRAAWERAIAATDAALGAYQGWPGLGLYLFEAFALAADAERMAARAYLAALGPEEEGR